MIYNNKQAFLDVIKVLNILFVFISVLICSILMLLRIPGMELLETNPNWLLIWVVSWSIKRSIWQGAIAGFAMGCIYDGISLSTPSHLIGFVLVGVLTSGLQKQKYLGEDFISIAFIVFFMIVFSETIYALQYAKIHYLELSKVFEKYKQTVVISATITSLWSPAFYYPFSLWNGKMKKMTKKAMN